MILVSFQTLVLTAVATVHIVNAKIERPSSTKWEPLNPSEVGRMYNNPFMSDVKFTFGNSKPSENPEVFYAHKYVLSISSPVFYKMFYGSTETVTKTIHLSDHKRDTLAAFLRFIYKDICPTDFEKDFEVLRLIVKYEISRFYTVCWDSLHNNIEPEKAYKFLEKFLELKGEGLVEMCLGIIDVLAVDYFASEYFLNIEKGTLTILLNRDTLYCNEMDIFKAVVKWADRQCSNQNLKSTRENRRMVLGNAIYSIRFLLMNQTEFTSHVLPTDILDNDEIVDIMKTMSGGQVPGLVWDSVKLKTKRFRENNRNVTPSAEINPFKNYLWTIFFEYFLYCISFIVVCIIACFCQYQREKHQRQNRRWKKHQWEKRR